MSGDVRRAARLMCAWRRVHRRLDVWDRSVGSVDLVGRGVRHAVAEAEIAAVAPVGIDESLDCRRDPLIVPI